MGDLKIYSNVKRVKQLPNSCVLLLQNTNLPFPTMLEATLDCLSFLQPGYTIIGISYTIKKDDAAIS